MDKGKIKRKQSKVNNPDRPTPNDEQTPSPGPGVKNGQERRGEKYKKQEKPRGTKKEKPNSKAREGENAQETGQNAREHEKRKQTAKHAKEVDGKATRKTDTRKIKQAPKTKRPGAESKTNKTKKTREKPTNAGVKKVKKNQEPRPTVKNPKETPPEKNGR